MNFEVDEKVSCIELAFLSFDQWMLTVALRAYSREQDVLGMVHVTFKNVRGFRYLDEGDMLQYPFPEGCIRRYVQPMTNGGWSDQESAYGNIVYGGHQEYLIATDVECVSILSRSDPIIIKELE